jgi:GcrA cell cycle regulator
MTQWTDAITARFKALHRAGRSFSKIAATLNQEFGLGLTKNACVGRSHRLGLKARPRPVPLQPRKEPEPVAAAPRLGWTVEPPVLPASCGRITIYQLEYGRCHFPFGERPPYAYCGNTTARKATYCPHHEGVMYPRGMR